MTEKWTTEQFLHYRDTGQKPEDTIKLEKRVEKRSRIDEKTFQTQCEQYMHHRGYRRLTADNACLSGTPRGWTGHLFNPKKNPLMPDIFIFNPDMSKSLMVELKVKDIWQNGQKEMVERGAWTVCFEFDEFVACVKAWEKEVGI